MAQKRPRNSPEMAQKNATNPSVDDSASFLAKILFSSENYL